jgi:hypothetical protein
MIYGYYQDKKKRTKIFPIFANLINQQLANLKDN